MNGTALNAERGIEDLSSFQSGLAHNLAYWESFSLEVVLMKHIFFLIGIHSMQG